jgi:hypothetical protein
MAFFLLVTSVTYLCAQSLAVGVGAGINRSWVTGAQGEPIKARHGAVRYARIRLSPSRRFAFEVGVQYSEKGYSRPDLSAPDSALFDQSGPSVPRTDESFRFTYLEIPVTAALVLQLRPSLHLQLGAGVSGAFNRAATFGGGATSQPIDISYQIRDRELNAVLLTGLLYSRSRFLAQFDVRYAAALSSYVESPPNPPVDSENRTVAFTVGAGIKLP